MKNYNEEPEHFRKPKDKKQTQEEFELEQEYIFLNGLDKDETND